MHPFYGHIKAYKQSRCICLDFCMWNARKATFVLHRYQWRFEGAYTLLSQENTTAHITKYRHGRENRQNKFARNRVYLISPHTLYG